ncbi:hypothetical protein BOTBODRAFT_45183 [Botryobasidium botryosum FD-172 SS1]|uniref:CCHC-type domain-containing protein n=1 Tax=Botryobasidium botryosum (strain FD-172 SS1) TaxID=930990 RepID=A0A067MNM8_BOTB1|nr:hypothetical protein BOTBODRAFT_45183 [Botryobasidium botryosum FD-172 SS1]
MAVIDTAALLQVTPWKGDDEADSGLWLSNFRTATVSVWGDDLQMCRAFQARLMPGSDAEDWYGGLTTATKGSWDLLLAEFDSRWPRETRVSLTSKEKLDRFKEHVLGEETLGKLVILQSGGKSTSHARWARIHRTYGRETGESDAWLIAETKANLLPPTILSILSTKVYGASWDAFITAISSISNDVITADQRKSNHAEERLAAMEAALKAFMVGQQPWTRHSYTPAPTYSTGSAASTASYNMGHIHSAVMRPIIPTRQEAGLAVNGLVIKVGPFADTPAGREEYEENIEKWHAANGSDTAVKSLDTPYPWTPGTIEPGKSGCHRCGMSGHSEDWCVGKPVPQNEIRCRRLHSKANWERIKKRALDTDGMSVSWPEITEADLQNGFSQIEDEGRNF